MASREVRNVESRALPLKTDIDVATHRILLSAAGSWQRRLEKLGTEPYWIKASQTVKHELARRPVIIANEYAADCREHRQVQKVIWAVQYDPSRAADFANDHLGFLKRQDSRKMIYVRTPSSGQRAGGNAIAPHRDRQGCTAGRRSGKRGGEGGSRCTTPRGR